MFIMFWKYKALVEKESGCQIVTHSSDIRWEFCSANFSNFCVTHGITCQLTTPYTPQQNVVVEQRNCTTTKIAQSMLEHRNIPKTFWAEAFYTTIYLLSKSPTQVVKKMAPEEAWSLRKSKMSHLNVFGFTAHVWILLAKHTKLDYKTQELMTRAIMITTKFINSLMQTLIVSYSVLMLYLMKNVGTLSTLFSCFEPQGSTSEG